jgi:hypothetical protein
MSGGVIVTFRGKSYHLAVTSDTATLGQLCSAVQQAIPGLAPHTLKLLLSKPRSQTVQLEQQQHLLLRDVGKCVLAWTQQRTGCADWQLTCMHTWRLDTSMHASFGAVCQQ